MRAVSVPSVGRGSVNRSRCVDFQNADLSRVHGVHCVVYRGQSAANVWPAISGDDEYSDVSAGQVLLVGDPLVGGDQQLVSLAFSLVQEFAVAESVPIEL